MYSEAFVCVVLVVVQICSGKCISHQSHLPFMFIDLLEHVTTKKSF